MIQDNIDYLLRDYDSVTLADMKRVSLMQRTDTKFVTSRKALLRQILLTASS